MARKVYAGKAAELVHKGRPDEGDSPTRHCISLVARRAGGGHAGTDQSDGECHESELGKGLRCSREYQ